MEWTCWRTDGRKPIAVLHYNPNGPSKGPQGSMRIRMVPVCPPGAFKLQRLALNRNSLRTVKKPTSAEQAASNAAAGQEDAESADWLPTPVYNHGILEVRGGPGHSLFVLHAALSNLDAALCVAFFIFWSCTLVTYDKVGSCTWDCHAVILHHFVPQVAKHAFEFCSLHTTLCVQGICARCAATWHLLCRICFCYPLLKTPNVL